MTLNGGVTYKGVAYSGFNNQRVNMSGTETPLPSNCYLSPMMWVADSQDNHFNTATNPASGSGPPLSGTRPFRRYWSTASTTLTRSFRAGLGSTTPQYPLRCTGLRLRAGKRLRWWVCPHRTRRSRRGRQVAHPVSQMLGPNRCSMRLGSHCKLVVGPENA